MLKYALLLNPTLEYSFISNDKTKAAWSKMEFFGVFFLLNIHEMKRKQETTTKTEKCLLNELKLKFKIVYIL